MKMGENHLIWNDEDMVGDHEQWLPLQDVARRQFAG
jgi:hypothetical protein